MNQLPAVAKKVFIACKKCDTDRYQVVLTHTSATTAKLECEVCHTKNSLTLEEPKRTRSAVPKKLSAKAAKAKAAKDGTRWNDLRSNYSSKPTPYNMKTTFETGAAVDHPKFGLGFVISVNGQAMQVIFEDAERSLVHNRS